MAAPKGNQYPLKWTLEKTHEFFDNVLAILEEDNNIHTLGGAALKAGQYEQLITYLEGVYPDEVFESIKKAREIVKGRLIQDGLGNKVNNAMAIFVLKNNHGMADKQEIDHKGKQTVVWHEEKTYEADKETD